MDETDRLMLRGRPVPAFDVVWLAGLLEGEGCFHEQKTRGKWKRGYPGISLQMTDEDVVARAATILGMKYSRCPKRHGHKDTFRFLVTGWPALDVMLLVRPYMGERRTAKIDELFAMHCDVERKDHKKLIDGVLYCKYGHALEGDNVQIRRKDNAMICRTCRRNDQRKLRAAKVRPERACLECGFPIPKEAHGLVKICSDDCRRVRDARAHREKAA